MWLIDSKLVCENVIILLTSWTVKSVQQWVDFKVFIKSLVVAGYFFKSFWISSSN